MDLLRHEEACYLNGDVCYNRENIVQHKWIEVMTGNTGFLCDSLED